MDKAEAKRWIGRNIAAARRVAGLSLRELSKRTGLSHTILNRYEKGLVRNIPSSVILKIADACGVPVGFILRPPVEAPPLEAVEYRSHKSRTGKKQRKAIIEKVRYWFEGYIELERLLGEEVLPAKLPSFKVASFEEAEAAAESLRAEWELGNAPIANLTALLEDRGFKVGLFDMPEGLFALTFKAGNHYVIAVSSRIPSDRLRFSLAHELGHLCLEVEGMDVEKAVNRFAGAFLVPRKIAVHDLARAKSLSEFKLLKRKYGVSIQTLLTRAQELGFISDRKYTAFMKAIGKLGWRKKEPVSLPKEYPVRFLRLVARAEELGLISSFRKKELEMSDTALSEVAQV